MGTSRVPALFRNAAPFSLQKLLPFSSSSAVSPRFSNLFSDDSDSGSSVYRHALKFQRPTTMKWKEQLCNSVSFIGSVDRPVQICATRNGKFGVYTTLEVRTSRKSNRTFMILLKMWDEMAEISFKHLRPNDFIYVSGFLQSYTKVDNSGELRTYYQVTVKELNYVRNCQGQTHKTSEKIETKEKGTTDMEKKKQDRFYLWQVFFGSPYEWWDNRRQKVNLRSPDFKHKDTGECLWLSAEDPPWVKRQLQLHDSRMAECGQSKHGSSQSEMSMWV